MSNKILLSATLTAFLLLPIFVSALRAYGPRWFTGILAAGIVAFVGWFLVNASIQLYFADLRDQLDAYGNNPPPQALADEWTNDGAKQDFGFLFGGFYALIYYAPFALLYEVARWARRLYLKRREQDLVL